MSEFLGFLISILVSFILGTVLTWIVGFEEAEEETQETINTREMAEPDKNTKDEDQELILFSPVNGCVVAIDEVNDEAFASKAMGDGVGIIPIDGKVYAPCDGTASVVFPTGHALGISVNGVDVLIHIGIDTVELDGKGFETHVKQGDTVKQGDLLVSFDKDFIEAQGYDSTVIFIVTDMGNKKDIKSFTRKDVQVEEKVIELK